MLGWLLERRLHLDYILNREGKVDWRKRGTAMLIGRQAMLGRSGEQLSGKSVKSAGKECGGSWVARCGLSVLLSYQRDTPGTNADLLGGHCGGTFTFAEQHKGSMQEATE